MLHVFYLKAPFAIAVLAMLVLTANGLPGFDPFSVVEKTDAHHSTASGNQQQQQQPPPVVGTGQQVATPDASGPKANQAPPAPNSGVPAAVNTTVPEQNPPVGSSPHGTTGEPVEANTGNEGRAPGAAASARVNAALDGSGGDPSYKDCLYGCAALVTSLTQSCKELTDNDQQKNSSASSGTTSGSSKTESSSPYDECDQSINGHVDQCMDDCKTSKEA